MTTETFWRRTIAIATVAVAAVALSGCSILNQITDAVDPGEGTTQDVFSIGVGDCEVTNQDEGEVSDTTIIDCAKPHATEIYASVSVPDGDFPGDSAIEDQAISDCKSEFNSFIGIDFDDSIYSFSWYFPTEGTWADGDREILCMVIDPNGGELTGSLAGIAE